MTEGTWYVYQWLVQLWDHAERNTKLDVAVYNAFHQDHLNLMIKHSKQIPRNSRIQRGAQFDFFSEGEMVGIGSRAPAGGAPADCYRQYDTVSARSLHDIDLLFNHAEVGVCRVMQHYIMIDCR